MDISFEILSYIIVGLIIGYYLDTKFNSMPLCIIIFTIMGFASSIYKLSKRK